MPMRPSEEDHEPSERIHTTAKWVLTLLSGVLAFSFVILLNEQL